MGAFHAALADGREAAAADMLQRLPGLANAANFKTGEAPLAAAVRARSLPLVQQLVRAGAEVNARDARGRTAREAAASGGAAEMEEWLCGYIYEHP